MESFLVVVIMVVIGLFVLGFLAMIMRASILWFWRVNDVVGLLEQMDRRLAKLAEVQSPPLGASVSRSVPSPSGTACHFCGGGDAAGSYRGHPICTGCASSFDKV